MKLKLLFKRERERERRERERGRERKRERERMSILTCFLSTHLNNSYKQCFSSQYTDVSEFIPSSITGVLYMFVFPQLLALYALGYFHSCFYMDDAQTTHIPSTHCN